MNILVTGGRGILGQALVPMLFEAGHQVRIASRNPQGKDNIDAVRCDLATGEGITDTVADMQVIVHAASSPFKNSQAVDVDGTRRLLNAATQVEHFIFVSIVGIDRIPFPYYKKKLAAEAHVESSGVPYTILRATQFHPLIAAILQPLKWMPVGLLPTDFQFQPIAPEDAAQRLVQCVADGPVGRAPDIGGPQVLRLRDMAKEWMAVHNTRRPLLRVPLPGKVAAGFRAGNNTVPHNRYGSITWDEWLHSNPTTYG